MPRRRTRLTVGFVLPLIAMLAACSETPAPAQTQEQLVVPLGEQVSQVQLVAGQTQHLGFTFALPPGEPITAASVDVLATLRQVHVNGLPPVTTLIRELVSAATQASTATIGISKAQPRGTICNDTIGYKPFTLGLDVQSRPMASDPATNAAEASTLTAINAGPFVYCVRVTPPVSAVVTLDGVTLGVTRARCTQSPASFAGRWTGTYQCTDTCGGAFNGSVDVQVAQDGTTASYADGDGTYSGTICGSTFQFARSKASETERGTLTLRADGTASRVSDYSSNAGSCGGHCTDTWTKATASTAFNTCTYPNEGMCAEYTGLSATDAATQQANCTQGGMGTWSTAACATTGRLGSCAKTTRTWFYNPPWSASSAQQYCTTNGGTWSAT